MRGIYRIVNTVDDKCYVGKSNNVNQRLTGHRCALKKSIRGKDTNQYLYAAVQKHGIDKFIFELVEQLDDCSESQLSDRELFWMDRYESCCNKYGYNLRRDSSTLTTTHPETCRLHARNNLGVGNPNYGNRWSAAMKLNMGGRVRAAHAAGRYGEGFRNKQRCVQTARWVAASAADRLAHGRVTSKGRQAACDFGQYDFNGMLLRQWPSVEAIITVNVAYKWQNIYAACNGNKPSAYGFMWRRTKAACVAMTIDPIVRKIKQKVKA